MKTESNKLMIMEIYTTDFCGYCLLAKRILKKKNIPFVEINLNREPKKRLEMNQRSNGRTSVPQIFLHGSLIGGYTELSILERNGTLNPLVFEKNSGADVKTN